MKLPVITRIDTIVREGISRGGDEAQNDTC